MKKLLIKASFGIIIIIIIIWQMAMKQLTLRCETFIPSLIIENTFYCY